MTIKRNRQSLRQLRNMLRLMGASKKLSGWFLCDLLTCNVPMVEFNLINGQSLLVIFED
jgi:hypothetical protein